MPSENPPSVQPTMVAGGVFIAWTRFQRRASVLAQRLGLELCFFHLPWETANRLAKALSYLVKGLQTARVLVGRRPNFLVLQLPPTPALYVCASYARLARIPLIVDCHNAAIMEHWRRWPLTGTLLKRAIVIAHNDHVAKLARQALGVAPMVLRTGIMSVDRSADNIDGARRRLGLFESDYILLPWSLHIDEPLGEAFDAMRQLPQLNFVLTGDARKIPPGLAGDLPANLTVTGYLPTAEFNELFAHAAAVLVLTTRDLTQLSGMAEAMAFEVPAVISDTNTTRFLYGSAPVYVSNVPGDIKSGIVEALETSDERVAELRSLRRRTEEEFERQVGELVQTIAAARSQSN